MWLFNLGKLKTRQYEKLSDIVSDLALVSIASVVLPAVFDKFDGLKVFIGTSCAVVLWTTSVALRR